jgi:hypothetical protein
MTGPSGQVEGDGRRLQFLQRWPRDRSLGIALSTWKVESALGNTDAVADYEIEIG